jgi:hypothetical protein
MLQTNCPKCKGVIESPYLNELRSVKCGQCREVVTVENVFVATGGFTIHREDLNNRISRYEKLLREVETERTMMAKDKTVSEKTSQSFDQFCLTLHELLEGARSHFRLKMTRELYLQMDSDHNKSKVKLIDISTGGASIECEMVDNLPRPKAMINLQMTLPKCHEPILTLGKVVWVRRLTEESDAELYRIGVKFVNLDEKARTGIWSFITEGSAGSSSFRAS